jgi:hypothetical protein
MMFLRLNTTSVPLSPQELRQALFPGPFVDYIDDRAVHSDALRGMLSNKEPDFRMRDIELLLRYLSFHYFLEDYAGDLRAFLDSTCKKLNDKWISKQQSIEGSIDEFEKSIIESALIFGEGNVGRKWTGDNFERRLNRAVLDVITFYFSDPEIRKTALSHGDLVLWKFKDICTSNKDFRSAIESTTKSLTATYDRLSIWGEALSDILPVTIPLPTWDEQKKRISFDGFEIK